MEGANASVRVARIDEVEPVAVAGGLYHPLRRALGVRAFGINAYSARRAGDQLIETHDETGVGSGGQEEAYVIVAGRAMFTVGDEEIDAPVGTVVFVPDVTVKRSAVATEHGTTALVVGGPADRQLPVSPFEFWFVAEAPYEQGDYKRAIEIASEGLEQWPDHGQLNYWVACYHALDGDADAAFEHLAKACAADVRAQEWAREDRDFDSIRDDPRWAELVG